MSTPARTGEERFFAKVLEEPDGCWVWQGALFQGTGYGAFRYQGRTMGAHKWAYEHHVSPVPTGLQLDHLCRNRACVNPWHLEPVTGKVNSERAHREHCRRGHLRTIENTYIRPDTGTRACRDCARQYRQKVQNS